MNCICRSSVWPPLPLRERVAVSGGLAWGTAFVLLSAFPLTLTLSREGRGDWLDRMSP